MGFPRWFLVGFPLVGRGVRCPASLPCHRGKPSKRWYRHPLLRMLIPFVITALDRMVLGWMELGVGWRVPGPQEMLGGALGNSFAFFVKKNYLKCVFFWQLTGMSVTFFCTFFRFFSKCFFLEWHFLVVIYMLCFFVPSCFHSLW